MASFKRLYNLETGKFMVRQQWKGGRRANLYVLESISDHLIQQRDFNDAVIRKFREMNDHIAALNHTIARQRQNNAAS